MGLPPLGRTSIRPDSMVDAELLRRQGRVAYPQADGIKKPVQQRVGERSRPRQTTYRIGWQHRGCR